MPKTGCSPGFSSGYVKQDTYNLLTSNSWSSSISKRLFCDVNKGHITTYFCVKNVRNSIANEIKWPSGSYCIAMKNGFCPSGFSKGSIKWDDKDIFNKNKHNGELPDGEFDRNTLIYFCCRSDGSYKIPMQMPVGKPFVLYRSGGHCQKVRNMMVQEDYIRWINEPIRNKDKNLGYYPDDEGGRWKHKLYYCYYNQ